MVRDRDLKAHQLVLAQSQNQSFIHCLFDSNLKYNSSFSAEDNTTRTITTTDPMATQSSTAAVVNTSPGGGTTTTVVVTTTITTTRTGATSPEATDSTATADDNTIIANTANAPEVTTDPKPKTAADPKAPPIAGANNGHKDNNNTDDNNKTTDPTPVVTTEDTIGYEYEVDERVLCFHGPLIYEAKCLKRRPEPKRQYFVHYNGWNKNWDEWVDTSRLLKLNDDNRRVQQELKAVHKPQRNGAANGAGGGGNGGASGSAPTASTSSSSSRKRKTTATNGTAQETATTGGAGKRSKSGASNGKSGANNAKDQSNGESSTTTSEGSASASATPSTSATGTASGRKKRRHSVPAFVETEEAFTSKPEIRIKIPDELKPCLVDDWDLITRQEQLFDLPAKITVDSILEDYTKQRQMATKMTPVKESQVMEAVDGIREYFNVMLGSQLLYRFERCQYQDQLATKPADRPLSSVYGAIHLLRLFTKFGHFLAFTALDEKAVQLLLTHVHDFLKYLSNNCILFFNTSDYSAASPEYVRKTMA
ncbi:unnamed protein product [Medioppia subpectinata]|uniref:MRG domain-containing protein n=1 Tax=Medioppia subpectinata TaxID=1979941 RepID=A0A7R9PYP1_9ACAR|nr:unnamed protein product [Medioppia subpectinata]CAG2105607.1 unnamed protein product [Medioppia subpectinata]